MKKTIAIIGGGAAGMMAAATILESTSSVNVVLMEKNRSLGRKVIISGGGRCNVTTGIHNVRTVLTRYFRGNPFLTKALYRFPPDDLYQWFEDHGVPLKTEEDDRVFPISNDGRDVVRAFETIFEQHNAQVLLHTTVESISKKDDRFVISLQNQKPLLADAVIITTGGRAYRETGSTGDGYAFAESMGHTITPLAASLNAFVLKEAWPGQQSGVSFEHVELRCQQFRAEGPIVLTHKGISGPAVFALSSQVAFEKYNAQHPLAITLDFIPDTHIEQLEKIIAHKSATHPKQQAKIAFAQWVPKSIVEVMMQECSLPLSLTNATISKKQRRQALQWLKAAPLHAVGRSPGSEFVTAGGVNTDEIHPATMESKIMPGLYFAGEVINVDGVTGGFNLQASWATGRLAGLSASE